MHFQIFYPDLINKSEAPEYFLVTFFVSISYTNYVIIISIFGLTKEMLPNRVVGCSVCSWATCARNQEKRLLCVGCKFAASWNITMASSMPSVPCTILKCHNSMSACVTTVAIMPITFPFPAHFVTFWSCFLDLFFSKSFIHQRLIREVFTIPGAFAMRDVQMAYSVILLLAQI